MSSLMKLPHSSPPPSLPPSADKARFISHRERRKTKREEWELLQSAWGGIFKLLWSPEIDSKESIPPVYVVWRAGTKTLFLLGSWPP